MSNIFKCITCNKPLTSEETKSHHCDPLITRRKTIEATSYFTSKNEKEEDCLMIYTLDGLALRVIVKEPNIIPLTEGLSYDLIEPKKERSDDFLHREQPDKDLTEPLKDGFKYYRSFLLVR